MTYDEFSKTMDGTKCQCIIGDATGPIGYGDEDDDYAYAHQCQKPPMAGKRCCKDHQFFEKEG